MRALRINLYGRHKNRCPFWYLQYRQHLSKYFEYVDDYTDADILISGFIQDYRESFAHLYELKKSRPGIKYVVVSEEPLWDTLWGGPDIYQRWTTLTGKNQDHCFNVRHFNHFNSDIFQFRYLPYFLTTEMKYFGRYLQAWSYAKDNHREVLKPAQNINMYKEPVLLGFFEKRLEPKYVSSLDPDRSLSVYRTLLAQGLLESRETRYRVRIDGKGWENKEAPRQSIGDWHLDKLSRIYGRSTVVFSYENTVAKNYITEKIFDAIFSVNVPLYFGNDAYMADIQRILGTSDIGIVTSTQDIPASIGEIGLQIPHLPDLLEKSYLSMLMLGSRLNKLMIDMLDYEAKSRTTKLAEALYSLLR